MLVVDEQVDPYWKLRPAGLTPDDEFCHCSVSAGVMLRDALSGSGLELFLPLALDGSKTR